MMGWRDREKTPGQKLIIAILIGVLLAIPLITVWALVSDRLNQSETATSSITEGWGGEQALTGPVLAIPYTTTKSETQVENGKRVTTARQVTAELLLSPETLDLDVQLDPERRKKSIYEAVVYDANAKGQARFAFPPDFDRYDIPLASMRLADAELRFGVADPKGLGTDPILTVAGQKQRLQPGGASRGGAAFFAFVDASALAQGALVADYAFDFRGSGAIGLVPSAGTTNWQVASAWPHPSFGGSFIPSERGISERGFTAAYRISNLALGRNLVSTGGEPMSVDYVMGDRVRGPRVVNGEVAVIDLIQPVDLYSRVDRATKYGFLHIGFTFLALLMFDVIGGRRVSGVAYLLVGASLVLFFVLLLAFAEVIGFAPAYLVASAAIVGLVTAYSAAILASWRRAGAVGGLLALLYAALYILLGLEEYALLIGALMIFAALAGVMYATRNLDWGRERHVGEVEGA